MSKKTSKIASYQIDFVLDLIRDAIKDNDYYNKKYIDLPSGSRVRVTRALRAFARHGVICSCCGREGSYFLEVYYKGNKQCDQKPSYHLELRTKDSILMGSDHTIPKMVGGAGVCGNISVMCSRCNTAKGCEIFHEGIELYRIASVKDVLKEKYPEDPRFDHFFKIYVEDMERRKKTDPYYGFIPYDGIVEYAVRVKELFGLEFEPISVGSNYFLVREKPFEFDFLLNYEKE